MNLKILVQTPPSPLCKKRREVDEEKGLAVAGSKAALGGICCRLIFCDFFSCISNSLFSCSPQAK